MPRASAAGRRLDKLGQRALNQGAVIFDNVVLPVSNVLAGPDDYQRAAYQVLVLGNACMGTINPVPRGRPGRWPAGRCCTTSPSRSPRCR